MANTTHTTENRIGRMAHEVEMGRLEAGLSRSGVGVIITMSALVGVWGVLCLVGGLGSADGLRALGRGLLTALTGL
ncbi:MAG: hypothetical protein AB1634_16455 [Thermodesulfobacteriota bacterium]